MIPRSHMYIHFNNLILEVDMSKRLMEMHSSIMSYPANITAKHFLLMSALHKLNIKFLFKMSVYKAGIFCYNMYSKFTEQTNAWRLFDMENEFNEFIDENEDWGGWLVQIKPEWLNTGERQIVYVVLEDRGPRLLIQELPQYKSELRTFLHTESVLKAWVNVIDKDIQKM